MSDEEKLIDPSGTNGLLAVYVDGCGGVRADSYHSGNTSHPAFTLRMFTMFEANSLLWLTSARVFGMTSHRCSFMEPSVERPSCSMIILKVFSSSGGSSKLQWSLSLLRTPLSCCSASTDRVFCSLSAAFTVVSELC
jgi:hypothetical protein